MLIDEQFEVTRGKKDSTRLVQSHCMRTTVRPAEATGDDHRRIETAMVGSAISVVSSCRTPDVHTYTRASHESSNPFFRRINTQSPDFREPTVPYHFVRVHSTFQESSEFADAR